MAACKLPSTSREGELRTGEIYISNDTVSFSLDVTSQGGVDKADNMRLCQIVDGGKESLIGEIKGKQIEFHSINGTTRFTRHLICHEFCQNT